MKKKNVYSLTVDYSCSIEDAVKAGNYDWKNRDINSRNFPTKKSGIAEVDVELLHFNRDMSMEEVLAELDKRGLRPAELHELLKLEEKFPNLQRKFPIIALGSVWRSPGGARGCPYLGRVRFKRGLNLTWIGSSWDGCRFAAIRKP